MRRAGFGLLTLLLAGCPAEHHYPGGGGIEGQLEREVEAMNEKMRVLQFQAAHCGQDTGPDPIYQDLYQLFNGGDVQVSRDGGVTLLTLPADYLFSGGTDLRDEAKETLDLLATALKDHPEETVTIVGHTDNNPPTGDLRRLYADNWQLSYARAEAVMVALVDEYGVSAKRFAIEARANYDPVATNDTLEGQRKNRRVVVRITPPPKQPAPTQMEEPAPAPAPAPPPK